MIEEHSFKKLETKNNKEIIDEKITKKLDKKFISTKNIILFFIFMLIVIITNYILTLFKVKSLGNDKANINNTDVGNETINFINLVEESNSKDKVQNSLNELVNLKLLLKFYFVVMISIFFINILILISFSYLSKKYKKRKNMNYRTQEEKQTPLDLDSMNINDNKDFHYKDKIKKLGNIYKNVKKINSLFTKFILLMLANQSIFQFTLMKFIIISTFSEKDLIYVFPYFHCLIIFIYIYYVSFNYLINFFGFLLGIISVLLFINNETINIIIYKHGISDYNITFESCILLCIMIVFFGLNYKLNLNYQVNYFKYVKKKNDLIQTKDTLENLNSGYFAYGENLQINYNKKFSQFFSFLINKIFPKQEKEENCLFSFLKSININKSFDYNKLKNTTKPKFFLNYEQVDKTKPNSDFDFSKNENYKKTKIKKLSSQTINFDNNNDYQSKSELESADLFTFLIFLDKKSIQLNHDLNLELKEFFEEYLLVDLEDEKFYIDINKLQILNKSNEKKANNTSQNNLNPNYRNYKSSNESNKIIINEQNLNISSKEFIDFQEKSIKTGLSNTKQKNSRAYDKKEKNELNSKADSKNENSNNNIVFINNKDSNDGSFQINNSNEKIESNSQDIKSKSLKIYKEINKQKLNPNLPYKNNDESISNNFNNSYSNFINDSNSAVNNFYIDSKSKQHIETPSFKNLNKNEVINKISSSVSDSNKKLTQKNAKSKFNNFNSEDVDSIKRPNTNYYENNLNSCFSGYLLKKQYQFQQLISLIKLKFSNNNEFYKLFSFKRKIDKDGIEELINLEIFFRYNKISKKIEFLFNDISHVLEIARSKVENKLKKKILNKFSHEFRNPLMNIIQLIKNLKMISLESKTNAKEFISSARNKNTFDKNTFTNNSKEAMILSKQKSNFENSELSDRTRIIANVEFASFSIYKEILEKENFFKRKKILSNKNSSNEFNSNSDLSNFGTEVINSNNDLEKLYLKKLKKLTFLSNNDMMKINSPKTVRNYKNSFINMKMDDDESGKLIYYKNDKNLLKSTKFNCHSLRNIKSTNKNLNIEYGDNISNTSNEIIKKDSSKLTSSRLPKDLNDISIKINQDKMPLTDESNNLSIYKINTLEENVEKNKNEIITDLNNIKYICYNLNFIINEFDFIANTYSNMQSSYKKKIDLENNILQKHLTQKSFILSKLDFRKMIKKITKLFQSKIILSNKNIVLNIDIDKSVPKIIKSSPEYVNQILFNLFSNSLKFTKIGCINLKVMYESNDSKLKFQISDTGIGIKKEVLNKIFNPFSKFKDDRSNIYGLGMGLFIVKSYIESLNGDILVESRENEYTKISFYIILEKGNTIVNTNSFMSKDYILDSSLLLKIPSIKTNNDSFENIILKNNADINLTQKDDNFYNNNRVQQISKICDNSEQDDSSVFEKNSYEENLRSTIIENPPSKRNKIILKAKTIDKIYKESTEMNTTNKNSSLQKFPKTYIKRKHLMANENVFVQNSNINLIRRKSYDISTKQLTDIFKKAFNFNNSRNYYKIFQNKNNSSLNRIQDEYRLFINQENSNVIFPTTINSNFFINNSFDKSADDLGLAENNQIGRLLSKFSNKSNFSNFNKLDSYNINQEVYKNGDSQIQFENNSESSIDEIKIKEHNNKQKLKVRRNSTFQNFAKNAGRIESNNINTKKSKTKNEDANLKVNQGYNVSIGRSFNEQSESQKTSNFENEFNFNYKAIKSVNPAFYEIKDVESDLKSNDNSDLNNSKINSRKSNEKYNQTLLSVKNLENNQIYSSNNIINSSPGRLKKPNNKKHSNLMLSKFNENKNILAKLTPCDNTTINNKNNLSGTIKKKFTEKIRILVVDDEKLIRQSNINLLTKFFKKKNINFQVYECEDGFDCLNYIYQAKLVGINFEYIITDQTMNFITGTLLSDFIRLLVENKIIKDIKMFLLTSYSASIFDKQKYRFNQIFTKPLKMDKLEFIFKDIIID